MDDLKLAVIAGGLPGRYGSMLRQVHERLPAGWDSPREFVVCVEAGTPGYACALRFEEIEDLDPDEIEGHEEQVWTVTLYPEVLDRFSDAAVRWVIAHELGHVASGCVCGVVIGARPMTRLPGTVDEYREITDTEQRENERIANAIARAWGFWSEEAAFRDEEKRL
jgi:hypothetical protein